MSLFYESGIPYPIPTTIKVIVRYYDISDSIIHLRIDDVWPTLPLVRYSRTARTQVAYQGKREVLLDGGDLCGGAEVYVEILTWLRTIASLDHKGHTIPPLQTTFARTFKDEPWTCLNYHRALLAFDLIPRAQQNWISEAMWRSSNTTIMPHPNWIHDVWVELSSFDPHFVDKTIGAAAECWKPEVMTGDDLSALKRIAEQSPDLWEQIDRALDAVNWPGYADWLISDVGEETLSQFGDISTSESEGADEEALTIVSSKSLVHTAIKALSENDPVDVPVDPALSMELVE